MADFIDPRDEGAVGGEEIPMNDYDDYDVNENTPLIDNQEFSGQSIQDEINNAQLSQVDRFKIEDLKFLIGKYEKAGIKSTNEFTDPNDFILKDKELRLKDYPDVKLLKDDGRPYAISTLFQRIGMDGLRTLGFQDYKTPKAKLPPKKEKTVKLAVEKIVEAETSFTEDPIQSINETNFEVDTVLKTLNDPPLILANYEVSEEMKNYVRELKGLDKAMQTQRGELTNNLAKLSQLDKDIAKENRKLTETNDSEMIDRINRRLRDYELERDARLESVSTNREMLRSQISRIKETINKILNEDETLGEKLRTLFREQGVTLGSLLAAISLALSTLILAITGGSGGGYNIPDKPLNPKDPGFIQKT